MSNTGKNVKSQEVRNTSRELAIHNKQTKYGQYRLRKHLQILKMWQNVGSVDRRSTSPQQENEMTEPINLLNRIGSCYNQ